MHIILLRSRCRLLFIFERSFRLSLSSPPPLPHASLPTRTAQVRQPVRSAITAAYMLRNMAKLQHVNAQTAQHMCENAAAFESRAVMVHKATEELYKREKAGDDTSAIRGLNCELPLWRGYSLLDLAVDSKSHRSRLRAYMHTCIPAYLHTCVHCLQHT